MMGNLLHTAKLLGSGPLGVAVFVGQGEDTDTDGDSDGSSEMDSEMSTDSDDHDQGSYVFTSFDSAQFDRGGFDLNDLDKRVSLEVDGRIGGSIRQFPIVRIEVSAPDSHGEKPAQQRVRVESGGAGQCGIDDARRIARHVDRVGLVKPRKADIRDGGIQGSDGVAEVLLTIAQIAAERDGNPDWNCES